MWRSAFGGDPPVLGLLLRAAPRDGDVERALRVLAPDEVVGAEQGLVEEPLLILLEVGLAAPLDLPQGLEEAPGRERDLLGIEIGRVGQVREVLAVVPGGVEPAAVHVDDAGLPLEGQLAVGLVPEAG